MKIQLEKVKCYSGYKADEAPEKFWLKTKEIIIDDILKRWISPDHRYFEVSDKKGKKYIIRQNITSLLWELVDKK